MLQKAASRAPPAADDALLLRSSVAVKPRDLMTPDTEPTDEELALVMREATALAIQRRVLVRSCLLAASSPTWRTRQSQGDVDCPGHGPFV